MGQSDTGPQVAPPIPPLGTPKKSRENSTRPLKNGFVINAAYSLEPVVLWDRKDKKGGRGPLAYSSLWAHPALLLLLTRFSRVRLCATP